MSYNFASTDYNLVAWMLGGEDPRAAELPFHRSAIADARRTAGRGSFATRIGSALRSILPGQTRSQSIDCGAD